MREKNNNYLAIENKDTSIIWMILAAIGYLIIYSVAGHYAAEYPQIWMQVLYVVIVCLLAIGTRFFYKTDRVFVELPKEGKVKFLTIFFCIMLVLLYLLLGSIGNWIRVFNLMSEMMWSAIFIALAAGIGEEFLCRVLLFNLFIKIFENKKYVLLWASLYSSILFGLFHLINLLHSSPVDAVLQQVFYATAIGLVFSYLHIFTNGIWLCVLAHFLLDLQPTIVTLDIQASSWGPILIIFGIVIIVSIICIYAFNKRVNKIEN